MRKYDLQTHAGETGGQSDPREELWLILHQARIEASFWGDLPSGIGLSSASVQPQLLDGRMVWLPAKRNVYTNTHNCSVRSHGELMILRRGALVRCCDFSETGARCSSGKQGGGGGGEAGWVLNWFPCLKLKHRQSPRLLSGPGEYILQQWPVLSGTMKSESHTACSWSEFKTSLGMKVSASILRCCIKPPDQVISLLTCSQRQR